MAQAPAGWYPDPSGAPGLRYWDGTTWTQWTHPAASGSAPTVDSAEQRRSLAASRATAGDVAGATAELKALLAEQIRVLGPDHPDTLKTRFSLVRRDLAGAIRDYEDLLPDQVRTLGADHPDTLLTRFNLAHRRGPAGDAVDTITDLQGVLADQVRILGPDHPDARATRSILAARTRAPAIGSDSRARSMSRTAEERSSRLIDTPVPRRLRELSCERRPSGVVDHGHRADPTPRSRCHARLLPHFDCFHAGELPDVDPARRGGRNTVGTQVRPLPRIFGQLEYEFGVVAVFRWAAI